MPKNVGNYTPVTRSRRTRCRRHIPPLRRRPCGERCQEGARDPRGLGGQGWCRDRSVRNGRASMRFRPHCSTRRAQARPARLLQIRRLLVLKAGVLVCELVVGVCLGRIILVRPLEYSVVVAGRTQREGHVPVHLHVGEGHVPAHLHAVHQSAFRNCARNLQRNAKGNLAPETKSAVQPRRRLRGGNVRRPKLHTLG